MSEQFDLTEYLLDILYDKKVSKDVNPFIGSNLIKKIMYLFILSKHNNDCMIAGKSRNGDFIVDLSLKFDEDENEIYDVLFPVEDTLVETYFDTIQKCNTNFVALPLTIEFYENGIMTGRHQNMIIINLVKKEIYRFEPHGERTFDRSEYHKIDDTLEYIFTEQISEYNSEYQFKYIRPASVCPFAIGFQQIEQQVITEYNEPAGYCVAWSYLIIDIVLEHPDKDIDYIMTKLTYTLGFNPDNLRNYIRSYVKFVIIEIEKILDLVFGEDYENKEPAEIKEIVDIITKPYKKRLREIPPHEWDSDKELEQASIIKKINNHINKRLLEQLQNKEEYIGYDNTNIKYGGSKKKSTKIVYKRRSSKKKKSLKRKSKKKSSKRRNSNRK
jgi:hypothetical protein